MYTMFIFWTLSIKPPIFKGIPLNKSLRPKRFVASFSSNQISVISSSPQPSYPAFPLEVDWFTSNRFMYDCVSLQALETKLRHSRPGRNASQKKPCAIHRLPKQTRYIFFLQTQQERICCVLQKKTCNQGKSYAYDRRLSKPPRCWMQ